LTTETLPEVESPLTQEPELQVDTSTEAPPATEQADDSPDVDALLGGFLKEKGVDPTAGGEGAQDGAEPKALTPEEAEARGREQAEAQFKAQQQEGLRRTAAVGYRNAIDEIDRLTKELPEETSARIRTLVNQMHSQSAQAHTTGWLDTLHAALAQSIPEVERRPFLGRRGEDKSYGDLIKDYTATVRKGYISEADAVKREKASYSKGATEAKAFFQEKGIIPGSKAPAAENGLAAARRGPLTLEEALTLPITEARKRLGS
jgi:hypothetical protein